MIKKTEVSVKSDSSQDVETLYKDLENCNREIQYERKFIKNGRQGSAGFPALLENKRALEAQLIALGLPVSQTRGMKPDSLSFFQSKGSAFNDYAKTKQEQVEETISMESSNLK